MGKANLYTVKDYQTGEVLAKGTAGELEASGIVPRGYHTSEWAKHENNRMRDGSTTSAASCCIRRTAPGGERRGG